MCKYTDIIFEQVGINKDSYKSQKEFNQAVCEKAEELVESGIYAFEIYDSINGSIIKVDGFNNALFTGDSSIVTDWMDICKRNHIWKYFEETYCEFENGEYEFMPEHAETFGITVVE